MRIDLIEFIDEATYSMENGDSFGYGIFPFATENEIEEDMQYGLYEIMKIIRGEEYQLKRVADAEENLKKIEETIIASIGKESYKGIMEIFRHLNFSLKYNIDKFQKDFDSLKAELNKSLCGK